MLTMRSGGRGSGSEEEARPKGKEKKAGKEVKGPDHKVNAVVAGPRVVPRGGCISSGHFPAIACVR